MASVEENTGKKIKMAPHGYQVIPGCPVVIARDRLDEHVLVHLREGTPLPGRFEVGGVDRHRREKLKQGDGVEQKNRGSAADR